MNIVEHGIEFYADRIRRREHFAFAGYSDAEWYCMLGTRDGEPTALGQLMSKSHGAALLDVLKRRCQDPNFLIAVPKILKETIIGEPEMDRFLARHSVELTAYERDMVTDDLAAAAGLFPLIDAIRRYGEPAQGFDSNSRSRVMIGNHRLFPMYDILRLSCFIGVDSPNLHMHPEGIKGAVRRAREWGQPGLYLVSAGVSAAPIIDQLWGAVPNSTFLDCGSIWDAFCGLGGQREWRAKLYEDPAALAAWKRKCLTGE